jgi:hypothetical protein
MGDPFVVRELTEKADLYRERNALYGDTYHRHGAVMMALYPEGLTLRTVGDFNRFGVLNMIVSKITRYSANWERGGHADSLDDISVYSMMLKELDQK